MAEERTSTFSLDQAIDNAAWALFHLYHPHGQPTGSHKPATGPCTECYAVVRVALGGAHLAALLDVAEAAQRLVEHIYQKDEESIGWLGGYALRLASLKSNLGQIGSAKERLSCNGCSRGPGDSGPNEDCPVHGKIPQVLSGDES